MTYKEYKFLNKTIYLYFHDDWIVSQNSINSIKVKFPFGPYPTLDCYLDCFDNPKLNYDNKIRDYILDGVEKGKEVIKIDDNIFTVSYEFKSESENLIAWKVLNFLKPRSFREIRLSLAWPENDDANKIVSEIIKNIPEILDRIKFSDKKTYSDFLGGIKYKLNNIKMKKYQFWDHLEIFLPEKWSCQEDKKESLVILDINEEKKLKLFFEYFNVERKQAKEDNDQAVSDFIKEITKGSYVNNAKFVKADNNNYIFSFFTKEENKNSTLLNHIWYRISVKDTKFLIISFIFNYEKNEIELGTLYYNKIDELIKSAELN